MQSLFPLQTASLGIQSPFEQVASDGAQAVGVRVGGGTPLKIITLQKSHHNFNSR